jgi:biotin carboxylase
MSKHIHVVGLDDFNGQKLARIDLPEGLSAHRLMAYEEVKGQDTIDFDALLETASRRLRETNAPVDGVIGWWDFPTTSLIPAICHRFNLAGPSLESVLKCEHKYWSRLVQREAIPDYIPGFCAVDPFHDDPKSQLTLDYPFWIKPVKGFASQLGFRIGSDADFDRAIQIIRQEIGRLGDPFDALLHKVDLPAEVAAVGGHFCIAEEIIGGRQCTLEGYVHDGDVEIYGTVDSIRLPNRSSFQRYQYPSRLPRRVQRWMEAVAKRVMSHIGYDNATFNMEFFWDPKRRKLSMLEINPRLSQSHADLFEKVHGVPHFQIMADLALGRAPHWVGRKGPANCAAKFFIRRFSDARVTAVPDEATIRQIEADFPGCEIDVRVKPGTVLSDLKDQDAYSFELADVFMGAHDQQELLRNFAAVRKRLKFRFAKPTKHRRHPDPEEASSVT